MDTLRQDLRYAIRTCAKTPGFTVAALLTMAVAIGANATVFSFVNALLLSPPSGVRSPGTLVSVYTSDYSSGQYAHSSYPDYESMRAASAFQDLAAYRDAPPTLLRIGDYTERVRTTAVTANLFALLGVRALQGRTIEPVDFGDGATPAAAISEALWRRAFGAEPATIGRTISINGVTATVVGIIPAGFTGIDLRPVSDIWLPLTRQSRGSRDSRTINVVGRLSPGTEISQAQAQLDGLAAQLAAAYPETNLGTLAQADKPRPFMVLPHKRLPPAFRAEVGMVGAVLLAAVGLVLLIACANLAALLLSRAASRSREVALRLALGAARGRLFRQILTESVLLSLAGGALGLLVALWTADVLPSFFPADLARLLNARVDWRVLIFTGLATVLSGLIFGIAPAVHSTKAAPADALRSGSDRAGAVYGGMRMRKMLVAAQVALSAVLLVSAALLMRSLSNAFAADLGYSVDRAVLSTFELPQSMPSEQARSYFDAVTATVRSVPGVRNVALAQFVPVAGTSRRAFTVPGYVPSEGESTEFHINIVSHTFFETMGITAIAGRVFDQTDRAGRLVAVINHMLANRYFTGDPVGQTIKDSHGRQLEVIGVVRADRRLDLQDPSLPVVFYLADQQVVPRMTLVAETIGAPALLADTVRRAMVPVNRDVAVFRTVTLESHLQEALVTNRITVALVGACGGMALLLALVGVYGVVSYTVARRTREIGVRVALGATPWQVLRPLVSENGAVVILGLVAGALASLGTGRLLQSMLYGVTPTDLSTFGIVALIVGVVAVVAGVLPATRALRVDPMTALRQD
jgi:predicted permease